MSEAPTDSRNTAREYRARNWVSIPIPPRCKKITTDDWQLTTIEDTELLKQFGARSNIGVLLGEPSSWLIDVDLDHPLAVELADEFLPPTGSEFGRDCKPRSHRLYIATGAATHKRQVKGEGMPGMLVELRSTGAQTVFPGSVHPSGEHIEWATDGDPALVDAAELKRCVDGLADEVERRLGIEKKPARAAGTPPRPSNHIPHVDAVGRCRKYVAKMPPAISGSGGHDTTFNVACECYRFGLDDSDALAVMQEYNQRCQPVWTAGDLAHKLRSAFDTVSAAGEFGSRLRDDRRAPPGSGDGKATRGIPESAERSAADGVAEIDELRPPSLSLIEPEERTELANARRLIERHGDKLRYVPPWRKWTVHRGTHWQVDEGCIIEGLARDVVEVVWDATYRELRIVERSDASAMLNFAKATASANGIGNFVTLARSEVGIPIAPADLDRDLWLLNVQNGTIDLRTGKLRAHRKSDFITKISPVVFDESARSETWERFVDEIMAGDAELIGFLQRLCGYWLTGSVREHILPIFHGMGANGKSVFLGTIEAMLGTDYAMHAPPDLLMVKRNASHPTERADLFGKRLVTCLETEAGSRLAESLVKELTGGDKIRARRMREDFWEFDPTHKLVIAANHRPIVRGQDNGVWRRLRLVPFTVTIPDDRQDKSLPERLRSELSGVLAWCVRGCLEWQRIGLAEPKVVLAATADYRGEQDVLGDFIDECCYLGSQARVSGGRLYQAYSEWCKVNGHEPDNNTVFGRKLSERGLQFRKSHGTKLREGIGLLQCPAEQF